jgi:tRNA pseudouridine38-40 synthase
MTTRFKAIVAYDGTNYAGYQIQPHHPTIQAELEKALWDITRKKVRVFSSGRTDQGVHARGQVIHFDLEKHPPLFKLRIGMNALLPEDIRVISVARARSTFDARMSARSKEYRYFIWNDAVLDPCARLHCAHVREKLDVGAMKQAAAHLVGEHDFAAFTANPRREVEGTVRCLMKLSIRRAGKHVVIAVRGDGFLYKMVRSLAGFLIRVGTGELTPDDAKRILHSRTRTAQVPTADPQGLFIWRVFY